MDHNKKVVELPLEDVLPNRFQPRIKFNEESIIELSESIKEHGVIQPIVVRPVGDKYEIIAGERRYKASSMAGLTTIPALITDLNDKDSAEVALIENVQRKDLTPIEEAISYKKILDMGYLTQEKLADKLGKKQSTVANKLRLLNLDEDVQEALLEDKISERHARSLLKLTSIEDQKKILNKIIDERLTVRKTDEEINNMLNETNLRQEEKLVSSPEVKPVVPEEVPFDFSKLDFLTLENKVEEKVEEEVYNDIPKFEDLLKIEEDNIIPSLEDEKAIENKSESAYENIFYTRLTSNPKEEEKSDFDLSETSNVELEEKPTIEVPTPFVFSDLFLDENNLNDISNISSAEPQELEGIDYIDNLDDVSLDNIDEVKPFNFSNLEENDNTLESKKYESSGTNTYVANDIKTVLNTIHNCAETIKKYGFAVDIEEFEMDSEYRVTFIVKK